MKSALEYATNIALVIVCGLLGWFFIKNHQALLHGATQANVEANLTGTVISPIPFYNWDNHEKTLVMGLQVGCHFCEASMPFYKRLSDLQQANRLHAYLLAVMPNDIDPASKLLRSNGVRIACACGYSLRSIEVSQTPTLLLVNAQGRVEREWVGQLASAEENQVISELEK